MDADEDPSAQPVVVVGASAGSVEARTTAKPTA
jgi:hypothetical protein